MWFLTRWLMTAIAVAAAVALVPGIDVTGNAWIAVALAALIVGLVNATIGLVFKIGAFGCIIMTFGLFNLVINALMLWLASWIAQNWFNLGFVVDGFWPAFWGGIVISIVTMALNAFANRGEKTTA